MSNDWRVATEESTFWSRNRDLRDLTTRHDGWCSNYEPDSELSWSFLKLLELLC
jgi:hypothetical protein